MKSMTLLGIIWKRSGLMLFRNSDGGLIEGEILSHYKSIDSRPKIEEIKPSLKCHLTKRKKNMEYGLG